MKKEEIEYSNELIAKFMGYTKPSIGLWYRRDGCGYHTDNVLLQTGIKLIKTDVTRTGETWLEDTPSDKYVILSNLKYHKSWDWLMPIVKKIEDMDVVASFQIEQPTIYIWASSKEPTFTDIEVEIIGITKLEAVYTAILQFIEWYNKNKKS